MRSSIESLVFANGALSAAPALLTRMSTWACASSSEYTFSTCAASVTSQTTLREFGICRSRSASAVASRPISIVAAPASASRAAIAAPIPREAPVTMAWRPERTSARTGGIPEQLVASRPILFRPGDAIIALLGCGMQRPIRIDQMGSREAAKVGAAGGQNAVHVIDLVDVADCHGGDAGFVPDEIGKRRLEHAAVHGPRLDRGLPSRNIDDVGARIGKGPRNHQRLRFAVASITQPVGRGRSEESRVGKECRYR